MIKKDKDKIYVNKIQMDASEFYFVYAPLKNLINLCRHTHIKSKFMNVEYEKNCIAREYTFLTSKSMVHPATKELANKATNYLKTMNITRAKITKKTKKAEPIETNKIDNTTENDNSQNQIEPNAQ